MLHSLGWISLLHSKDYAFCAAHFYLHHFFSRFCAADFVQNNCAVHFVMHIYNAYFVQHSFAELFFLNSFCNIFCDAHCFLHILYSTPCALENVLHMCCSTFVLLCSWMYSYAVYFFLLESQSKQWFIHVLGCLSEGCEFTLFPPNGRKNFKVHFGGCWEWYFFRLLSITLKKCH